jgi:acetamidase/formamidase
LALHEIPLERSTLHGHFSRDLEPVLEIDSGDSVRISTPNAGWYLASGEPFEPRDEELDAGHALAGPIAVRGADAGATLAVRIDEVVPGPWGVTLTSPPHLIRWELADGVGRGAGMGVELRPFLGVLGMPPPEQGIHSTGPPRRWGGNIDCADLLAGSTLYLPIPVDGALFSAGDGHARQGDGEICGTAIECPSEATVTLTLVDGLPLEWPIARTPEAWLAFGFGDDLDTAARIAADGIVALISREHGLGPEDALAVASVVADLRVTQIVNGVVGVHAQLRHDAIDFTTMP